MGEAKFQPTGQAVTELIESIDHDRKRSEAYELLELFEKVTGRQGKVWYPGIIGFGRYHYQYDSGREGEASIVAFAPRKSKISIYLSQDFPQRQELLDKLGKCKPAVGCIYVNKLADIDLGVLEEMIEKSMEHTAKTHEILE